MTHKRTEFLNYENSFEVFLSKVDFIKNINPV